MVILFVLYYMGLSISFLNNKLHTEKLLGRRLDNRKQMYL